MFRTRRARSASRVVRCCRITFASETAVFRKVDSRRRERKREKRNEDDNQRTRLTNPCSRSEEGQQQWHVTPHAHSSRLQTPTLLHLLLSVVFIQAGVLFIVWPATFHFSGRGQATPCEDLPSSRTSSHGARGWHAHVHAWCSSILHSSSSSGVGPGFL